MLLNFSDRTRTGVFNMVWPYTSDIFKFLPLDIPISLFLVSIFCEILSQTKLFILKYKERNFIFSNYTKKIFWQKFTPSNRIWTSDLWISAIVTNYSPPLYQLSYRGYRIWVWQNLKITIRHHYVRMAEWSKALRSGRSPLLRAWVRIPLLTIYFPVNLILIRHILNKFSPISAEDSALDF